MTKRKNSIIYNSNTSSFIDYLQNLLKLAYMTINHLFAHEQQLNIDYHCGVQNSKMMYLNEVYPDKIDNYRRHFG